MRRLLGLAVILLLASSVALLVPAVRPAAGAGPCDGYGDCLSSSVSYVRSNPDRTLYLGDQFTVALSPVLGPGVVSSSVSWTYDTAAFSAQTSGTGGDFRLVANVTSATTFTVLAQMNLVLKLCGNCSLTSSSVQTSVGVTAIPFAPTFKTSLANVTDALGNVMRNPDGSFYRNDTLCVSWNATFPFQKARTDIRWNITSLGSPSLKLLNASSSSSMAVARDCFSVRLDAPFKAGSVIAFSAHAYAWTDQSLSNQTGSQPFAVVSYDPSFTYMTYTDYNSNASRSMLGRPFVTLVRYDWNDPGYGYTGDSNTGPITAQKDLRERAWINNFTFASEGWRLETDLGGGNSVASAVSFANSTADLGLASTNKTQQTILPEAVEKYYFASNFTKMAGYVANGSEYFNATVGFRSKNFAGGDLSLFNATYLYQPIFLSGTLTFNVYSGAAPDTQANVTLVVHNTVPLGRVLTAQVLSTFGNDPAAIRAFDRDLYPADNLTQVLKPASVSEGGWTFVVNQTNWGSVNSAQMPQLTITVSSGTRSFSYSIPEAMSLFQVGGPPVFAATPFGNITGYYLDQSRQLLMLPINSTFAGSMPYLVWDYGAGGNSSSLVAGPSPYFSSTEPGTLSRTYPFIFGQSNTVNVNLGGGGGVFMFPGGQVSDGMRAIDVLANDTSGGIVSVVADVNGKQTILTSAMQPNNSPLAPPGFFGIQHLEFPADYNGTVSFQVTNSWGASWTLGSQTVSYHAATFPVIPVELLTFFTLFLIGLRLLADQLRVRRS